MVHRILLLVAVLLYATGSQGSSPLENIRIEIKNGISPSTALTVHCKSKDDDLGPHIIQTGQVYSFAFKVNFFVTTQFFCNFLWKSPQGVIESKWYDIYKAEKKLSSCSKCDWTVHADQICRYSPVFKNFDCFPYNKA